MAAVEDARVAWAPTHHWDLRMPGARAAKLMAEVDQGGDPFIEGAYDNPHDLDAGQLDADARHRVREPGHRQISSG